MFVLKDPEQAIDYAKTRACFRADEIRILDSSGNVERTIHLMRRTENCNARRVTLVLLDQLVRFGIPSLVLHVPDLVPPKIECEPASRPTACGYFFI